MKKIKNIARKLLVVALLCLPTLMHGALTQQEQIKAAVKKTQKEVTESIAAQTNLLQALGREQETETLGEKRHEILEKNLKDTMIDLLKSTPKTHFKTVEERFEKTEEALTFFKENVLTKDDQKKIN